MIPLISVIMSEYNTNPSYLKESINSILNQNYKNFEFIIIDDCTNQINAEILIYYSKKDQRVRLLRNEVNLGLAASLNKAISVSQGNYIFRMDTDDICTPDRISKQLKLILNGENIVTSRAIYIDYNGIEVGKSKKYLFHNLVRRFQLYWTFRNPVIHSLIAAKKEVFLEFGYDEKIRFAQDFELWIRMKKKYKIYFDKQLLMYYREPCCSYNDEKIKYQLEIKKRISNKYANNFIKQIMIRFFK